MFDNWTCRNISAASSYISAKATGQKYTVTDGVVAASAGIVNAIPGVVPYIAGVIAGGYSAYKCRKNGGLWWQTGLCFCTSGLAVTAGIGNLANLGTASTASIVATGAADLVFGTGYACAAEAVNQGICQNANYQKRH